MLLEPRFAPANRRGRSALELPARGEQIFFDPAQDEGRHRHLRRTVPGHQQRDPHCVFELMHNYGVPEVLGIRYGYRASTRARAGRRSR